MCEKCDIITCAGIGHHLRPDRIDRIIKEMPGSVASGTPCTKKKSLENYLKRRCSSVQSRDWNEKKNYLINLLKTKRNLLYLKTLSVPRCKHFPPRL